MTTVYIYQEAWETKLQERLDKPQNWKEVCDVRYSDTKVLNIPYIGTTGEPAVGTAIFAATGDRSTLTNVIPPVVVTETNESLTIATTDYDSVYVDYADQAQSQYAKFVDLGELLGKKIGERVESIIGAAHADWTNIGDDGTGNVVLGTTALTVSATNIDDIVRGVIEQIQTANGFNLYQQKGGFIVWAPKHWTKLVAFMQANGFATADSALQAGNRTEGTAAAPVGVPYMGLYHYVSTLRTSGHCMAGIRQAYVLGLLKSTYGKTYVTETPPGTNGGLLSGTQIHTRLDYGLKLPTNLAPVVFDVNTTD